MIIFLQLDKNVYFVFDYVLKSQQKKNVAAVQQIVEFFKMYQNLLLEVITINDNIVVLMTFSSNIIVKKL